MNEKLTNVRKCDKNGEFTSPCSAIILAGGQSNRMGFPKAFLPLPNGNIFQHHIYQIALDSGAKSVITVIGPHLNAHFDCSPGKSLRGKLILNPESELGGRISSLFVGIKALLPESIQKPFLVLDCDRPFIEPDWLRGLVEVCPEGGWSFPSHEGKAGHPICIGFSAAKKMLRQGFNSGQGLNSILPAYPSTEYPVADSRIFMNINTPEDYFNATGKPFITKNHAQLFR